MFILTYFLKFSTNYFLLYGIKENETCFTMYRFFSLLMKNLV